MNGYVKRTPLGALSRLEGENDVVDNLIVHIPHSSMYFPVEYAGSFSADSETIKRNLIALTDFATDDLFCHPQHQNRLIFPISRLLCDVERFRSDDDEIMSKRGMGVVYTHGAYGELLRSNSETLRIEILERYYDTHHDLLLKAVTSAVAEHGYCIILDAHSFPSKPLPYELDQNPDRADFCIGTDIIHTPETLSKTICCCITKMGYTVEMNKPYSGTIVPLSLFGTRVPVMSVMVEVNRRLYMDETSQKLLPQYDRTKTAICRIFDTITEWMQTAGRFSRNGNR